MKKIFVMLSAVVVALTAMCITAFAATEDVELSVTRAMATNGMWGQSITYSQSDFNAERMTPDTQVLVEYELDGEMPANGWHPVELIFQRYEVEPVIWAQIYPSEFDEDSAVYNYDDIFATYTDKGGAEDFSDVNNICFGDSGVVIKVTKVTITNCKEAEVTTTTAATETETEKVTEAETTVKETETEATTTTGKSDKSEEKQDDDKLVMIVAIIAVVVVVIAAAIIVVVVIKKNRRRFY